MVSVANGARVRQIPGGPAASPPFTRLRSSLRSLVSRCTGASTRAARGSRTPPGGAGGGDRTAILSGRNSGWIRHPRHSVMSPPQPLATTAPPTRTKRTTCSSSASVRGITGFSTARIAGRWARVVARLSSFVRRRSVRRPNWERTSYNALLPRGPVRKVEERKSNSAVREWRLPAHTTTPRATVNSRASPISSRYDMGASRQVLRGSAEGTVLRFVAGDGAEQVAIQLSDQRCQRGATRRVETRLGHVLGGRFGDMKTQRLPVVELQDRSHEAVRQRFGVSPKRGELLGPRQVRPGVHHDAGRGGGARSGSRHRLHDAPHDVADVHQHRDERDDEQRQENVEPDGMTLGESVEPVLQVLPLPRDPRQQALLLDPLILGT